MIIKVQYDICVFDKINDNDKKILRTTDSKNIEVFILDAFISAGKKL